MNFILHNLKLNFKIENMNCIDVERLNQILEKFDNNSIESVRNEKKNLIVF